MEFIERIVNGETNEIIEKPYSDEQLKELEEARFKVEKFEKEQAEKNAVRLALLERLGITEDEAKLLLS